jgi:hypothetical protein
LGFVLPATLGGIEIGLIEELSRGRSSGSDVAIYHHVLVAHVVYAIVAVVLTAVVDATFDAACGRMSPRLFSAGENTDGYPPAGYPPAGPSAEPPALETFASGSPPLPPESGPGPNPIAPAT